jgi:hypothetical protein
MVTNDASKVYSLFKKITYCKIFFDCHKENKYQYYIAIGTQKKYEQIIYEVESNNITPVYSQMGYYIHGFKLSIYNIKRLADMGTNIEDDIYYKIMCDVCDFGGDTDTNCAIVGAMIGPLIGYKNFNKKYFDVFIRFIPYHRCQFNSAFMYIYVNYLEECILKQTKINENNNNIQIGNNNLKEEMKNPSLKNNDIIKIEENIKTVEKKDEAEVKKDETVGKKDKKDETFDEAKDIIKGEIKEEWKDKIKHVKKEEEEKNVEKKNKKFQMYSI